MTTIAATQLATHIKRGLKNLYVVMGDEPLLLEEVQDALRQVAREAGYGERSVFVVSGANFCWGEVLASLSNQSLFADRSLIELRIPTGKVGKDGGVQLQKIIALAHGNLDVLVIIQLPKLDKATRSTAWFNDLEKSAEIVTVETIARNALPAWIAQRLAARGLKVANGQEGQWVLQLFTDRVEGNLLAAHQEIEKLCLLIPEASPEKPVELSRSQIDSVVLDVARYDVFQLSDLLLSGQLARVERMLIGLEQEGESEVLVHFVVSEDIRALKAAKDLRDGGKPLPMVLRELRIWGNRERHFERVLPKMSAAKIAGLLQGAHVVDGVVKGVVHQDWPRSGWPALRKLANSLCVLCQV